MHLSYYFLQEAAVNGPLATHRNLTLEFVSFADGKEAVAKAANYLFVKHYANGVKEKPEFTEPQMGEALGAIGILSLAFSYFPDFMNSLQLFF